MSYESENEEFSDFQHDLTVLTDLNAVYVATITKLEDQLSEQFNAAAGLAKAVIGMDERLRDEFNRSMALVAELTAAKSRIGDLEQERGAEGTNWFPESFVSQLQAQLQSVQAELAETRERCDHFCKMALVPDGTESRKEIAQLQAQLAAVTQERDTLKQARITCDHCTAGFNGRHEVFCQIYAYAEQLAQLQARNQKLRGALHEMREHAEFSTPQGRDAFRLADRVLASTAEEPR
jgi:hypothetical protein